MADNLTNEAERGILDHIHGLATYTIATPLTLALLTTAPNDNALGSEPSGGSYARQSLTVGAADSNGMATNTATVTFTNMPACTIAGFAIYDSSTTPKRIWHGPTSELRTLADGDTYEVAVGGLTMSLS